MHKVDWKQALNDLYCQGLIHSGSITFSEEKLTLKEVFPSFNQFYVKRNVKICDLLKAQKLPILIPSTQILVDHDPNPLNATVRHLAQAYAFVIESVDKEQEINLEVYVRHFTTVPTLSL
jgi:hypothetical protein